MADWYLYALVVIPDMYESPQPPDATLYRTEEEAIAAFIPGMCYFYRYKNGELEAAWDHEAGEWTEAPSYW